MTQRSLLSRIAFGSILWTLAILAGVVAFSSAHFRGMHVYTIPIHFSAAGFAAAILVIAALLQFRRGLSPFDALRRQLQAVRDGSAATVSGQFPPEVAPVVDDLNALLVHQSAAVTRAQAEAGDLAHGLKTPLAILRQEAERAAAAGQIELADTVRQQIARMERHVTFHLARARAAASGATVNARASVRDAAEGIARTLQRLHAEKAPRIDLDVDATLTVRLQAQDLEEVLGNLLDNACKWCRARIEMRARLDGQRVVVVIDDDGAGIAAPLRAAVLQRGVRADEAAPGSGLGLAIVRDLVELYGGSITLSDSPLGGLRVSMELPACQ